jgi:hypothetical protein
MVIDLKNMKYLTWDTVNNTIAHVGAGSLLGDLTTEMLTQNRAMAHGTCPQVGSKYFDVPPRIFSNRKQSADMLPLEA